VGLYSKTMTVYSATDGRNKKQVRHVYIYVSATNYQTTMLIVRFRTLLDQIPVWSCQQTACLKVLKMANFLFSSQVLDCRLLKRKISDES